MILILSSPSGAGKTTLTRMMLQDKSLDLTLSISVTTRARRSSDGVHYQFLSRSDYDRMKSSGDLLESAEVHGNGYGTPRRPVEAVLSQGRDMLFDIDWQGARQVRTALGDDVVSIFVLPPSMKELRMRLERRAEDSADTIDARLAAARKEIERWRLYDYVIVNDDLQRAYRQVVAIVEAERARQTRLAEGVESFVADLIGPSA